ncbi:uncharacterized protein LOC111411751 [Olea europaea var. sylvestris]|uniref:Uncharacterized protein n=1 Tax=Olea europaea subsp. europaea TaxID=158383 RepID=A0A8S0VPQ5_OLEEU|nr:uncharacterized protein LOC111411751 [Olea europaea var. sylvestris]CAA3033763.1 Hypothetical predicted protein [Olea europaea subsp. europaea]
MASFFCSTNFFLLLILLSAVPVAFIIHLETSKPATHVYEYHSTGWFRECTKWDDVNSRFLVSFMEGGFGEVPVPKDYVPGKILKEIRVVENVGLGKNSSLGFVVDRPRNRVVVSIADVIGNLYSAVAAYDLTTWERIFLTKLSGPEDGKAVSDDVAVDPDGNAYVTDVKGSKIWKVGVDGKFLYHIINPLFTPKGWYNNLVGLNGIVHHPNGYLLVVHTFSGNLYKVEIDKGDEVKLVKIIEGSLKFGDGLELLSPTKLVVAGNPSKLVESLDDWESGSVVAKFKGATHRLVTAAMVKDGKVYLNHLFGLGYPKRKHVLVEADFSG